MEWTTPLAAPAPGRLPHWDWTRHHRPSARTAQHGPSEHHSLSEVMRELSELPVPDLKTGGSNSPCLPRSWCSTWDCKCSRNSNFSYRCWRQKHRVVRDPAGWPRRNRGKGPCLTWAGRSVQETPQAPRLGHTPHLSCLFPPCGPKLNTLATNKSVGETQECEGLSEDPWNDSIQPQERSRVPPTPIHAGPRALSWIGASDGAEALPPGQGGQDPPKEKLRCKGWVHSKVPSNLSLIHREPGTGNRVPLP